MRQGSAAWASMDLELRQQPNGKYDFVRENGDLRRTSSVGPSVLRLLLQGTWVGDDGQRAGDSLLDVKILNKNTDTQVRGIVENRLNSLVQSGELDSVDVKRVDIEGDRVNLDVATTEPGRPPEVTFVRLTR